MDHSTDQTGPTPLHPIDIAEDLAQHNAWEMDRIGDDHLACTVHGVWGEYVLSLGWHETDETLRLVCAFEFEPVYIEPLLKVLDAANAKSWVGHFNLWSTEGRMVYRYALCLRGGAGANREQIQSMMTIAIAACERYRPAFVLSGLRNLAAEKALEAAVLETRGRA